MPTRPTLRVAVRTATATLRATFMFPLHLRHAGPTEDPMGPVWVVEHPITERMAPSKMCIAHNCRILQAGGRVWKHRDRGGSHLFYLKSFGSGTDSPKEPGRFPVVRRKTAGTRP